MIFKESCPKVNGQASALSAQTDASEFIPSVERLGLKGC